MKKRTSTNQPIYPPSYKTELIRGTPEWAKQFNKWSMYIRGELADDRMLKQAKKILLDK